MFFDFTIEKLIQIEVAKFKILKTHKGKHVWIDLKINLF